MSETRFCPIISAGTGKRICLTSACAIWDENMGCPFISIAESLRMLATKGE